MQNTAQFKQLVHEAIEENPTIQGLKSDVAGLKTDVAGLKTAVQETNHRLDGFMIQTNERFDRLEVGIAELKESVLHFSVMYESLQKDMKIVLEALVPARQRVVQIDQIEERVEDHDHRINAVEISVKNHLADHHES